MKLLFTLFSLTILITLMSPASASPTIDLSGTWKLKLDGKDQMLSTPPEHWQFNDSIQLPGTTDLAKKGPHITEPLPFEYHLQREYAFVGPAYYSRTITIPEDWNGSSVQLFLERVMWQSRVWLDGKEIGKAQDSLNTPHIHNLGKLPPGKHQLTLRIDNRMIHPIGNKGHAYGNETQSTWNGVVGKIELRKKSELTTIDHVRIFAGIDGNITLDVTGKFAGGNTLFATCYDPQQPLAGSIASFAQSTVLAYSAIPTHCKLAGKVTFKPTLWSEFSPKTYRLEVRLTDNKGKLLDTFSTHFGFRSIAHKGNQLLLNGKPAFMRGNLECAVFPKTGHPPVTVAEWTRIWNIYKKHNLNHARFHSWCPPEAAFTAADNVGIYLQVEAPIWMDHWMSKPNPRKEMDTQGYPKGLGKNDRGNDLFAQAEIRRTLDTYGNHPSFVFFCIGNELGTTNFDVTGKWIRDAKKHDPRHLYAASTARTITPYCDYNATHNIPGIGWTRQHYEFSTNWDYEKNYSRAKVPIIAHEIGQWPVYVDWKYELPKYTGPLKPYRLIKMAQEAKNNGIYDRSKELRLASGAINRILYRDEIESFLRTPSCRGFQLLGMQDFSGQGEALVGWLDSFYDSKGTTDPAIFRQYCAPTVPLLKLPSYIFTHKETPEITALVHHYGQENLDNQAVTWALTDEHGQRIDSGKLPATHAPAGAVTTLGKFKLNLSKVKTAAQLKLTLHIGDKLKNSYNIWVYNTDPKPLKKANILITSDWESEAKPALAAGKRVLLIADKLGGKKASRLASWMPLYWSVPFFPGQNRDTIGLRISSDHPAFASFPTPAYGDWNWRRLCRGAHGFDLTDITPNNFRPIAEPVSDFHYNRRLGSIFSCKVAKGTLLVCGYNLKQKLPEAKQLLQSLTSYVASSQFQPKITLTEATLDNLFRDPSLKLKKLPKRFAHADLYVHAAGKLQTINKSLPWNKNNDQILRLTKGVNYHVKADGIWRDNNGSAWHGKSMKITITPRAGAPGTLYLHLADWNNNGRTGSITCEGKTVQLGAHTQGKWIKFTIIREDTNDAQLLITTHTKTGPNLMITDIAFVPKEE